MPIIVGIDVGVQNLAMAVGSCSASYTNLTITAVERVNLMSTCTVTGCTLHHTGMASDRVAHFLQARAAVFAEADTVVIERQPPGGLRDVEQVLVTRLRDKAVVMAPQTMHVAIGSNGLPYAERKVAAIARASLLVPDIAARFAPKADDPADAVCFVIAYVQAAAARRAAICRSARAASTSAAAGLDLSAYVYTGRLSVAGGYYSSRNRDKPDKPDKPDGPDKSDGPDKPDGPATPP